MAAYFRSRPPRVQSTIAPSFVRPVLHSASARSTSLPTPFVTAVPVTPTCIWDRPSSMYCVVAGGNPTRQSYLPAVESSGAHRHTAARASPAVGNKAAVTLDDSSAVRLLRILVTATVTFHFCSPILRRPSFSSHIFLFCRFVAVLVPAPLLSSLPRSSLHSSQYHSLRGFEVEQLSQSACRLPPPPPSTNSQRRCRPSSSVVLRTHSVVRIS